MQTRASKRAAASDAEAHERALELLKMLCADDRYIIKEMEHPGWEQRREARKPYVSILEEPEEAQGLEAHAPHDLYAAFSDYFEENPIVVILQVLCAAAGAGALAWLSSLM